MEWLILRLHRLHVERFGPITTDLSNWIRVYREYLRRDKELLEMVKRHKAEAREFNRRIREYRDEAARLQREFQSTRNL